MRYPQIDIIATGERITLLMKVCGLSVSEVQNYLGLSAPQAVYKWLRGKNLPSIDNLFALSKIFGVSINEILIEDFSDSTTSCCFGGFLSRTAKFHRISYSYISLQAA